MEATKTELAEKIRKGLEDLNFLDVAFDMAFERLDHFTPGGYDEAQFLISTNPGQLMLILGMGLFSLGAEQSMTPIGTKIGTALTKTKNLPLILGVSFLLGFAITVAEPDLQVLAETVPHISSTVLLVTVGIGVPVHVPDYHRRESPLAAAGLLRADLSPGRLHGSGFSLHRL